MIIEQVEALKVWLTNKLSPICDAEPSALAKYVCALVKKDKSEQDLRDICVDQLDVFLQQNTKPFVEELFKVLKSKDYIPPASEIKAQSIVPAAPKPESKTDREKEDGQKRKFSEISSTTDDKENKDTSVPATTTSTTATSGVLSSSKNSSGDTGTKESKEFSREVREPRASSRDGRDNSRDVRDRDRERDGSRDRRDSWRDERNREGIRDARDIIRENRERGDIRGDTREVREPRDRDFRDRDFRRRRTRSRSFSPRRRDFGDDRRRRFEDRPRYSPDRRWGRRRSWSRSPRRNRSPFDRIGRARSRSPRARSRSPRERYRSFRSRTRSRSPRPRSWSRPGSGGRPRTRSLSYNRQPDSRGSTPLQDNDFISSSTNDQPTVTSTVGLRPLGEDGGDSRIPTSVGGQLPPFAPGTREQCQNFEEKGFCTLGDFCPYDHGTDPVVVEGSIPSVLPGTSTAGISTTASGFVPPDLRVPPPGHMAVRINLNQPPPPHVEPYLPEAPGLQGPMRPFMRGPLPDLRQPPPGMMINRPPAAGQLYQPRREVIINRPPPPLEGRGDMLVAPGPDKEPSRIVIPAKRPYSAIDNDPNTINLGPPPAQIALISQQHETFGGPTHSQPELPPQVQPPLRRGFDYSRLGSRGSIRPQGFRPPFKTGNLSLEVRKIPLELNNIAKLNEHFSKFGTLTNIQVKFQGDPGAALISYSNNGEATSAYRSPEPVFNNRFIKLYWHNAEKKLNLDGENESPAVLVVGEEGREMQVQQSGRAVTGGRVGDGIDHPSLMLPVRSSIPPAHKLQLDNTKPKVGAAAAPEAGVPASGEPVEKSIIYTSSVGNLKKTVFNPAASAAAATAASAKVKAGAPFVSPTAVKTADYVSRMEAIKRAEEEKKIATVKQAELEVKKQELLAKQIEQQKLLLETLEKKKATMSDEEKQSLFKALRTISDAIDKVKYGTGAKKPSFQSPSAAQFKYVSAHDQSRKEMMDLELEIMAKQSKGEDTTALRLKMQELVNKAQGTVAPYGRGRGWASNRGSGWAYRGRGRGMVPVVGRTYLDNRPKTIEVKGFDLSELEEIKAHFQRFGETDKIEVVEEVPSAFFTFSARPSAEMAVAQGGKFKKKTLIVRWNQFTPKITRAESTQSSEVDDDLSITLGSLDEEAMLGEDEMLSNLDSGPVEELAQAGAENSTTAGMEEEDSHAFVEDDDGTSQTKHAMYEHSLSEELLAGEEENFKASYTDDEDDEDHITVTLSNTTSEASTVYSSSAMYSSSGIGQEPAEAETMDDDLSQLENTELDYNEEGSWA